MAAVSGALRARFGVKRTTTTRSPSVSAALHVAQQVADGGMALGLQRRQREGDVFGLDRAAVVEGDAVAQVEFVDAAVGRHRDLVGGVGIDRVGLVGGAPHQRGERLLHVDRRIALEDEAVERIERRGAAAGELAEGAALRRGGIDVFQMLEIGRIAEIAERGQAVVLGLAGGLRHRVNAVVLTATAPAPRIRMSRREKSFEVELKPPLTLLLIDISSPNSLPTCPPPADIFISLRCRPAIRFFVAPIGLLGLHP